MIEFKLPEVGENITSGQVFKIRVSSGDRVKKDQTLIELETEKATIEVPSSADGVITAVLVSEGETLQVGQTIVTIETGESRPDDQETADTGATGHEEPTPPAAGHAPDKSTPKQDSPSKSPRPKQPDAVTHSGLAQDENGQIPVSFSDIHAAPSVRRLARELGVDLHQVTGSGPEKSVTEDDVKLFVKEAMTARSSAAGIPGVSEPLPDFSRWGDITREPLSSIRKATASHLSRAWAVIPHVTQFGKADITRLEELRKKYSTSSLKLTITPFLLKVAAAALKQFPKFNASLDTARQEIIYKNYIHIGVAVDTEGGLVVPVIRDVHHKSILTLAQELSDAAERARTRKLAPDDMKGGSFTVTNLGGLGAEYFTPIINWPEAAILGVCRANMEPCFSDALCAPRLMLPLALSYDHRLIDGADGARFMRWTCDALENPFLMELH